MNWKQKLMAAAILAGCIALVIFKPERIDVALTIISSLAVAILAFEQKGQRAR